MSIYFGSTGTVELKRKAGHAAFPTLEPSDISIPARRFTTSQEAGQVFIVGDEVEIERIDRDANGRLQNLQLISGHNYPDWRGYISVDALGGLRLYDSFADAVTSDRLKALELIEPTVQQELKIQTRNTAWRGLAQVTEFDFTTEREQIDITVLRENFKSQFDAGLISGQGSLNCFWEHKSELCEYKSDQNLTEFPNYLAQLCIRLIQGADFLGRFYIFKGEQSDDIQSVWYEAECIVQNCTVNVPAAGVIETSINFLTTKTVSLRTGYPPVELITQAGGIIETQNASALNVQVLDD